MIILSIYDTYVIYINYIEKRDFGQKIQQHNFKTENSL